MDEEPPKHRPSVSQLSKTPSWVTLGFILGVLFVLALPKHEPETRTIMVAAPPEKSTRAPEPPQLTTAEAVFDEWASYAVWDNDITQVALWNSAVGDFAEFYEIRRIEGQYYFRSIPKLTGRVLRHGKLPPPECPLRFTETDEQYREWREQGRFERPPEEVRRAVSPPKIAPPVITPPPFDKGEPITPPAPSSVEKNVDVLPKK